MYCWCGSNDSLESNIARGWVADFHCDMRTLEANSSSEVFFFFLGFCFVFVLFWVFFQLNKFSAVWNLDWRQMKRIIKEKKISRCLNVAVFTSLLLSEWKYSTRGGIVPLSFQRGRAPGQSSVIWKYLRDMFLQHSFQNWCQGRRQTVTVRKHPLLEDFHVSVVFMVLQ